MKLAELIKTAPEEFQEKLQKEYNRLYDASETLEALEQGGVDNWEWYGDSLKNYFGEDEED